MLREALSEHMHQPPVAPPKGQLKESDPLKGLCYNLNLLKKSALPRKKRKCKWLSPWSLSFSRDPRDGDSKPVNWPRQKLLALR